MTKLKRHNIMCRSTLGRPHHSTIQTPPHHHHHPWSPLLRSLRQPPPAHFTTYYHPATTFATSAQARRENSHHHHLSPLIYVTRVQNPFSRPRMFESSINLLLIHWISTWILVLHFWNWEVPQWLIFIRPLGHMLLISTIWCGCIYSITYVVL